MSGPNNGRDIRGGRPNDQDAEYLSTERSSPYQGPQNTGRSRHMDVVSDDAQPRFIQPQEPSNRHHRGGFTQGTGSTLDRQDQRARSRDRAGRDRATDPQHAGIEPSSDNGRNYGVENRTQAGKRAARPVPEPHPQESTATPRLHAAENLPRGRPAFQSRLGQLARVFASIEEDDYVPCRDFIVKRPEILDEKESDFIRDAVIALASSQSEHESRAYARRCIQQSLIIRHCKERDRKAREKFFALLEEEEKKTAVSFSNELDATFEKCFKKAQELQEATSNRPPTAATAVIITHRINPDIRRDLPQSLGNLVLERPDNPRHAPTGNDTGPFPRPSNAAETQEGRHHGNSLTTASSNPTPGVAINQSGLLRPREGTLIRGTTGRQEALDASYFKREHAAQFFITGRVFALLWHEAAGEPNNDRLSERSFPGRFDEPIISHIRRMVVIREGHGNCWAIPVNTYGRHGVAKHGFKQVDVDGHAVIYSANTKPYTSPQEPAMTKAPLKVDTIHGEKLDRMSRINFTTVHTVQHNVKVKNIGIVHPSSKDNLREYWSAQAAA